ncbi:MAG: sulfatase family protein [Armatimonadota bacterium]
MAKVISRREMLKLSAAGVGGLLLSSSLPIELSAAGKKNRQKQKYNVLFINTDQQRFDAMSCAGNNLVSTPNLDRLAKEGVRFTMAVTPQPMCTAARTSFHTGLSIYTTGCVATTKDPNMQFGNGTWDQNLAKHGYHTEYHGRWHEPEVLTDCYKNEVTLDFIGPYKRYLREKLGDPPKPAPGQFVSYLSGWPYNPDPIDYELRKSKNDLPGNNCPGVEYGEYTLPADYSYSAYVADQTIDAMRRLKDTPFSMTCAILHPHHPQYVPSSYAGTIDPAKMLRPLTMNDKREGMPYEPNNWQIDAMEKRYMKLLHARYYELVQEADYHIGRMMNALDELGLADNTIVIFTSDHGEMLGDHGLTQKFVHYQESIRIPMIIRLPDKIKAGTVVDHPVNSVDIFSTIFDYLGLPCPEQEGLSLRPLIEGKSNNHPEFTFSEMVYHTTFVSNEWKYVWCKEPSIPRILYNLKDDPHEMRNLLGDDPDRLMYIPKAREIHKEMLAWMTKINHPLKESVASYEF